MVLALSDWRGGCVVWFAWFLKVGLMCCGV